MTKSLPANPDISHLRKQAKTLLKQFRGNDIKALETVRSLYPKPEKFINLRDAQMVVARSYGFDDWIKLSHAVAVAGYALKSLAEKAETFIQLGCTQYRGNDTLRNYQRATHLLARYPEIADFSFYTALVSNNLQAVQKFLQARPELVNSAGGALDWHPLLYVTYGRIQEPANAQNAIEIARLLLAKGADANAYVMLDNTYRFTALTGAMGEGEAGENQPPHQYSETLAKLLLEAGACPNDSQGLYNTMFTAKGDKWLAFLVSHGLNAMHMVNWNDANQNGRQTVFDYLLATAASDGYTERVNLLLREGANPNTVDRYNNRPVHTSALLRGHNDIAATLVLAGATQQRLSLEDKFRLACVNEDVNSINALLAEFSRLKSDASLLHDAAANCSSQVFRLLIESGFDIDAPAHNGRTLLHHFAFNNNIEQVEYLLNKGARIDIRDNSHHATAARFAAYAGAHEAARLLLDGSTNFLDIVCNGYFERAEILLGQNPALAKYRSTMGNTPLHLIGTWLTEEPDYKTVTAFVGLLLESGADLNTKNDAGQTPVEFCLASGAETMADLLSEIGG